jgi:hypothetical protein
VANVSTNWHHLVVVFDNGDFRVYWDGSLAGSTYRELGVTTDRSTQLGSVSPTSMSEGWVGLLDEVAFYADALTAEAVQAHYQAFFAGTPPVIIAQPRSGIYLPNVPLELSVKATGPSLAYQWYRGTNSLAGKTDAILAFPSLGPGDAGAYSVTVTNPAGVVTSATVTVALESSLPEPLVRYQTAISNETSLISYYTFDRLTPTDALGLHNGALMGTAAWGGGIGGGAAQGLMLDGAGHLSLGYVTDFDFTSGTGTVEGWVRADWGSGSASSAYPCMFADRDGATRWSLHLNNGKTVLTFYNGIASQDYTVPGGGAGTTWHHVAMVFDAGTATYYWDGLPIATINQEIGNNFPTVQFGSSAANTTAEGWIGMLDEIAFYSSALSGGSILAHYNAYYLGDPPVITSQPSGGYFLAGQAGQISVVASGAQLSYQWYKNGDLVTGATNATIGSGSLTVADSGTYHVVVSNTAGSTNSTPATIQVGNNLSRYQASVLNESSLISYYTFDAGDGQDSKNANLGVVANAAAFSVGPGGVTNQSLTLDGFGHFDLGQVADFDFTNGNGTVEGWIRADWATDPGYDPCLFADRNGGSVWSVHMSRWKNEIGNWNSDRFQTLSIPGANGWHHYAIAFGGGKVSMYWDGKPLGTFAQAINYSSGRTTQIGSSAPAATAEGWRGGVDEVAFYRATLDDATIWNHFLAMVGPESPPAISYSRSGNQLTLSWPANATGFTPEYSDSLPATTWTPVGGVVGNSVTVELSSGNRYYRLKK